MKGSVAGWGRVERQLPELSAQLFRYKLHILPAAVESWLLSAVGSLGDASFGLHELNVKKVLSVIIDASGMS